jgi:gliding motility-associated-like protein
MPRPFLLTLLAVLLPWVLSAQSTPPQITYITPQRYPINKTVTPLVPKNTGGAVPPVLYGQVTTFAGNGTAGFVDGTDKQAQFDHPVDITFDKVSGNLYVADTRNQAIRKVTLTGTVTTFAGDGRNYFNGIGSSEYYVDANGTAARFNYLDAIGADKDGNIFVSDRYNRVIRKVDPQANVTTYAGQFNLPAVYDGTLASAFFNNPQGIVFNSAGDMIITDGNCVRKIDVKAGRVITIAGDENRQASNDGVGKAASFFLPWDAALDKQGNIFIAELNGQGIRKIDPNTLKVSTVVKFTDSTTPFSLAINNTGNMYVCDTTTKQIREVSPTGRLSVLAGHPGNDGVVDGIGEAASFKSPTGMTFDAAGNLYIADRDANVIRKIAVTGYTIDKPLPPGMSFDQLTGTISGKPTTLWPLTTYIVTAYNSYGSGETTVDIEVVPPPPFAFGPITAQTVCAADLDPAVSATSYTSDDPSVATVVDDRIHIVGPGTTKITAINGDQTITQVLTVTAATTPSVTIKASATVAYQTVPITFTATASDPKAVSKYQWYVNNKPVGTNSSTFTTSTLADGDAITCETTNSGCTTNANAVSQIIAVTIKPIPVLVVPNTFTPNGDGINDLWDIAELENFPDCKVTVYNRWGTVVYSSIGYVKPWNGAINNKPLPIGTYYFIIDPKLAQLKILKGWVAIIK